MNEQTKNAEFIKVIGITLIPVHLFFFYYPLMRRSLHISWLDPIYLSLNGRLSMVNSSILMNTLAVFMLLVYAITTPIGKDKELKKSQIVRNTSFGCLLILMSAFLFYILPYNQWGFYVYIIGLVIGYYC